MYYVLDWTIHCVSFICNKYQHVYKLFLAISCLVWLHDPMQSKLDNQYFVTAQQLEEMDYRYIT